MSKEEPQYTTAHADRYAILKSFSKENRSMMTDAEIYLWRFLRYKQLGVKFRRQHIIGDYIVDFVSLDCNLIIEVDGGYHESTEQKSEDEIRQHWLEKMGYKVLRFSNDDIFENIELVINKIKIYTQSKLP